MVGGLPPAQPKPPRNGEGDRAKRGGGVFTATAAALRTARRERRSGNLPEVLLGRALRTRPGGFKFRRQHPISRYSLDFACLERRLAIEIDGQAHERGDRPALDTGRDTHLARLGLFTLRIPAREVLRDLDAVVSAIVSACRAAHPLHHPAPPDGPPPRAGEVFVKGPDQ